MTVHLATIATNKQTGQWRFRCSCGFYIVGSRDDRRRACQAPRNVACLTLQLWVQPVGAAGAPRVARKLGKARDAPNF